MDKETTLLLINNQIDIMVDLLKDNESKIYLYSLLTPIKFEIQRQIEDYGIKTGNFKS